MLFYSENQKLLVKVFPLGLLIYADIVFIVWFIFLSTFHIQKQQDKLNNANYAFIFLINILIVVQVVQVVTINNSKVNSQMR